MYEFSVLEIIFLPDTAKFNLYHLVYVVVWFPLVLPLSVGTCINNTSVFMFKKGCFELGATIYPVVIKVCHLHFVI